MLLLPPASPARRLERLVAALPLSLLLLSGCSDAPLPLEPRVFPEKPQALAGPIITVSNTDDAGAGSLRQAIIDAPAGATIQFAAAIAGKTIVLSTGQLEIDKALTVEGPASAGMTISGGLSSRVFYVAAGGDAVLRNLSIVDGRATDGGGILVIDGKLTVDHSLVANNEAVSDVGGGIKVFDGELVLVNSTVSGNSTQSSGGGVGGSGDFTIRNSTIAFNTADNAGGLFLPIGSLIIRNSIIANNVVGGLPDNCRFTSGTSITVAGPVISNNASCGMGSGLIVHDPKLLPLANNGGPTKTHAIQFGPAVDAGTSCSEATDQRYVVRNQGTSCDLGAFEFTDYGTVTVTLNPNAAVNAKTGTATLTGTVKCSAEVEVAYYLQMTQTQKTTGRFTTVVSAIALASTPNCTFGPVPWTVVLTPPTGKFEPGAATVAVTATALGEGFLQSKLEVPLKLFQVK